MRKFFYSILQKYGFVLLFFVLTVVFFWHFLFPNSVDVVSFAGHMSGDTTGYFYPAKIFTVKMWAQGKVPLWNPYIFSGYPHYADLQTQTWYPLNLLLVLAEKMGRLNYLTFEVFEFFHIFLGAVFAFLLGRKILKDSAVACLIGIIYGFSNIMLVYVATPTILTSFTYIPLVFLATLSFLKNRNLLNFCFLVIALSLLGASGYPNIFIMAVLFVFAFFTYEAMTKKDFHLIIFFLLSCFLTGLILAVAIIPSLKLQDLSVGGRFGYTDPEANWQYSNYPPSFLLTFFFPDNPFWIHGSLYIGLSMCLFACFSIYLIFKRKAKNIVLYFVLAILACFTMFGRTNFFYYLLYLFIPGFSAFRFSTVFGLFFIIFLAIMAGWTVRKIDKLDSLHKNFLGRIFSFSLKIYFATISFIYVLTYFGQYPSLEEFLNKSFYVFIFLLLNYLWYSSYLKNFVSFAQFKKGLVALLVFELLTVNKPITSMRESPYEKYKVNDLVVKLKNLQKDQLYRLGGAASNLFGHGGGSVFEIDTTFSHATRMNLKNYRLTGLEAKYGLKDYLNKDYYKFLDEEQFYDLLNVKYLMDTSSQLTKPGYNLIASFKDETKESEYWPPADVYLYERETALPRFYFISNWKYSDNLSDMAKELQKRDPLNFVVFSGEKEDIEEIHESEPAKNYQIEVNQIDEQSAELTVGLENDGFLVFSDVYYPGWKATVDGENKDVKLINGFLKGVYLTRGQHSVRFYFKPDDFVMGARLSLFGITLTGLLLASGIIEKYKRG